MYSKPPPRSPEIQKDLPKSTFHALKVIYLQELYDQLDDPALKFEKLKKMIEKEISIHKTLNHDQILKYYDSFWFEEEKFFLIELELAEFSLASCLKVLTKNEADDIFYQICSAVQYLHRNDIIHRDLKPANILIFLSKDQKKIAKIADFGGAKLQSIYASRQKSTIHGGTIAYLSPEKLMDSEFTKMSDIWALGIIYHQMLSEGTLPFSNRNEVLKGNPNINKRIPNSRVGIINGNT